MRALCLLPLDFDGEDVVVPLHVVDMADHGAIALDVSVLHDVLALVLPLPCDVVSVVVLIMVIVVEVTTGAGVRLTISWLPKV